MRRAAHARTTSLSATGSSAVRPAEPPDLAPEPALAWLAARILTAIAERTASSSATATARTAMAAMAPWLPSRRC